MEGYGKSGPGVSGSGSPVQPEDAKANLLNAAVLLHFFGVVVSLIVIGTSFGWLAVSLSFVAVTIFWIIWLKRESVAEDNRRRERAILESREQTARFSAPREIT